MQKDHNLIFFDGVCNLCNSSVNFIIARDKKKIFKFGTLQGSKSKILLKPFNIGEELFSIIYIENGKVYSESAAILRIGKKLGGLWALTYVFIIVPKFIRDAFYRFVSRNRYMWFGKRDVCRIPEVENENRFI